VSYGYATMVVNRLTRSLVIRALDAMIASSIPGHCG